MIKIEKLNEAFLKVTADDFGIEAELNEYFSFFVPGYKYMPLFRNKLWSGKAYLYDIHKKLIQVGLLSYIEKFANLNEYQIEYVGQTKEVNDYPIDMVKVFCSKLNLHARGNPIEFRGYQINAIHQALNLNRCILLSPTSSGKSAIIYALIRWHINAGRKCLIVVPSTTLVEQMYSDFYDYSTHNGWSVENNCNKIYSGFAKEFKHNCAISTWQSLYKLKQSDLENIDVVIGDECHTYAAKSATQLLNALPNVKYRIGTTGTLNGKNISELQLTGLFGEVYKVITTKELMDNKEVTPLNIKCLLLNHPKEVKDLCKKIEYQKEIKFLTGDHKRNKFIRNLALSLDGVTLILFNYISHGKSIFNLLEEKTPDRNIHYISGEIDTSERNDIRTTLNSAGRVIKIYFEEMYIIVAESEDVKLTDGSIIKAKEVTTELDIDNDWIKSKKLFKA
jgi:superfamily II DNA or RNA helicase